MFPVILCFLALVAAPPPLIAPKGDIDEIVPTAKADNGQAKGVLVINPLGKGNIQGAPLAKCAAVVNHIDCGFPGITADQCAIKGCCFSDVEIAGPYCYHADGVTNVGINTINPVKDAVCTFSDLFRVSCGEFTELECVNRGCCFAEASDIKCSFGFIPVTSAAIGATQVVNNQIQQGIVIGGGEVQIQGVQAGECAIVAAGARVDCGVYGITEEECTQKGCCFGLLPEGDDGPVCFEKAGAPKAGVPKSFGYKNID